MEAGFCGQLSAEVVACPHFRPCAADTHRASDHPASAVPPCLRPSPLRQCPTVAYLWCIASAPAEVGTIAASTVPSTLAWVQGVTRATTGTTAIGCRGGGWCVADGRQTGGGGGEGGQGAACGRRRGCQPSAAAALFPLLSAPNLRIHQASSSPLTDHGRADAHEAARKPRHAAGDRHRRRHRWRRQGNGQPRHPAALLVRRRCRRRGSRCFRTVCCSVCCLHRCDTRSRTCCSLCCSPWRRVPPREQIKFERNEWCSAQQEEAQQPLQCCAVEARGEARAERRHGDSGRRDEQRRRPVDAARGREADRRGGGGGKDCSSRSAGQNPDLQGNEQERCV